MTRLDDVCGINEIFSDGAPRDEPSLVGVDQLGNERAKAKSETFSKEF